MWYQFLYLISSKTPVLIFFITIFHKIFSPIPYIYIYILKHQQVPYFRGAQTGQLGPTQHRKDKPTGLQAQPARPSYSMSRAGPSYIVWSPARPHSLSQGFRRARRAQLFFFINDVTIKKIKICSYEDLNQRPPICKYIP